MVARKARNTQRDVVAIFADEYVLCVLVGAPILSILAAVFPWIQSATTAESAIFSPECAMAVVPRW